MDRYLEDGRGEEGEDEAVLARVSWPRMLLLYIVPFLVLMLLYLLVGRRPWSEVVSAENLMRRTPWRPIPIVAIICTILFVGMIASFFVSAIVSGGRALWIAGGMLHAGIFRRYSLRDMAPRTAAIVQTQFGKRLVLRTHEGREITVPLLTARYDALLLLETLERRLRQNRQGGI